MFTSFESYSNEINIQSRSNMSLWNTKKLFFVWNFTDLIQNHFSQICSDILWNFLLLMSENIKQFISNTFLI